MQTEAEQKLRDLETGLRLQVQRKEQELSLSKEEVREVRNQLQFLRKEQAGSSDASKLCEELKVQVQCLDATLS